MSSLDALPGWFGHGRLPDLTVRVVAFIDFYAGVASLVALSIAVMLGVLAMDRILLQPRHRLQAQLLHRAVAGASMTFLVLHAAIRVLDGHVRPLDLGVPFLATGRTFSVGLGTVAAWLMVLLVATGIARSRFAQRTRPTLWRVIHALAYVAWPAALFHGLHAGRAPKSWVDLSYAVCIALVLLGLAVRALTGRRIRRAGWRHGRVSWDIRVPLPPPRRRRDRRSDMVVPRAHDPMVRRRR
jgi:DMSO/TMAO reductase YedYZ heme-binding membrane subunit